MTSTQEAMEWMDVMDAQLAGRAPLSTRAAWTLAMTWEKVLKGNIMRSICETSRRASVLKTYAWVHFKMPASLRLGEQYAEIVRATTLVWFALSSVPGFQVHENPIFWKYVLAELRRKWREERVSEYRRYPRDLFRLVTDASRFVDDEFPRVSIEFVPAMFRVVTGLEPCKDEDTRNTLHSILDILAPMVDPVQARRVIPLKMFGISVLNNDLNKLDRLCEEKASIYRPRFYVTERKAFGGIETVVRIPVGHAAFSYWPNKTEPPASIAATVLSALHVYDKPFAHTKILEVVSSVLLNSQFGAICSALPHARVLQTLDIKAYSVTHRPILFSKENLAWLGYALFHPDTATSSWKRLNSEFALGYCENALLVLQRMAQGNHLASILAGSFDKVCSAYYSAQFPDGTKIQVGSTTVVANSNTRYDICVCSDDMKKLPRTVSVVVPGFGLGMVEKSRIKAISSRPPSTSTLTALDYLPGEDLETRLSVLRLLCPELTFLDATSLERIDAVTVREILGVCPKLTSLSIEHDGSFWATTDVSTFESIPLLTELRLELGNGEFTAPSAVAASTTLGQLEVLRLGKQSSTCLPGSRDSIIQAMQRIPGLRYIHYDCKMASWPDDELISYGDGRRFAWKELGIDLGDPLTVAVKAVRPACKRAFLSVVATNQKLDQCATQAVGRLHSDMLSSIFAFAGTPLPREFWVGY